MVKFYRITLYTVTYGNPCIGGYCRPPDIFSPSNLATEPGISRPPWKLGVPSLTDNLLACGSSIGVRCMLGLHGYFQSENKLQ